MAIVGVDAGITLVAAMAAVFFAMEAVLVKRGIEAGGSPLQASIIVAGVSLVVFTVVLAVTGDLTAVPTSSGLGLGVFFVAGVASNGFGVLAIYHGVERVGAGVNTAVVNSRPLFAALLGAVVLSEALAPSTTIGIVVLVVGLALVTLSRGGDVTGWRTIDLIFPLFAAMSFAFANMARRYGLTEGGVPLFEGLVINAFGGLVALGTYIVLTRRGGVLVAKRRSYAWFVLTGCSTSSGLLTMFFALGRERVAIVDSIVALSPLFALVLTAVFLREFERITLRVCLGAMFVVAGVIAIVGV